MVQKVYSAGVWGIDGFLVSVEADMHDGLPGFVLTGNLSQETREASDRVRTALKNVGVRMPPKKVTVNLSPADIRKEGAGFDLAIAAAVLEVYWMETEERTGEEGGRDIFEGAVIVGEIGLDGAVKPVRGVLSLVLAARERGIFRCFLPAKNVREGRLVEGMEIVPVESLRVLWEMIRKGEVLREKEEMDGGKRNCFDGGFGGTAKGEQAVENGNVWGKIRKEKLDFSELNGQPMLRRATEIAVAGRHNLLYIGAAGTGKTMAARRIPTIMPPLEREESLEVSKVYSICGMLPPDKPLVEERPFRSPHHTITATALVGGGTVPRPGEISLSSEGVLFLDELPEFAGKVIELLRQPLEERKVTVSRLYGSCTFPAKMMLVAAMNPCPCGFYPDRSRCRCSSWQIRRYIGKISKPILDRIDITVEASPVSFDAFRRRERNESSAQIQKRVIRTQRIQQERGQFNGEMGAGEIERYCGLGEDEEGYLRQIYQKMGLSARGCHKILKVARTIADLEQKERIEKIHLCEAVGYRSLEEKYWG